MIELSKRVLSIAKDLNVQKPVRENLTTMLELAVDVDDPLGNKMSGGYIFNVVNSVAVDICVKVGPTNIVKCMSCKDAKTMVVYEVCEFCYGRGSTGKITAALAPTKCFRCEGLGEFKTLIPCQDCKMEK